MAAKPKPDQQIWLGAVVADLHQDPTGQRVTIRCTKFYQKSGWKTSNEYNRQDLLDLLKVVRQALEQLA